MFFMSQIYFLNGEESPRTVLAILFFALAIMILLYDGLTNSQKYLLFIIFAASCVVSHYSTTYIFLLILILTWVMMQIIRWFYNIRGTKTKNIKGTTNSIGDNLKSKKFKQKYYITIVGITLIFIMIFVWYGLGSGTAFRAGIRFMENSVSSLQNIFDMTSRNAGLKHFLNNWSSSLHG
jgi:uncharacterized membrane protein